MDKVIQKIYYGMIVLGFILILVCGIYTQEDSKDSDLNKIKPQKIEQESESVKKYYIDVSDYVEDGAEIAFFSHHHIIRGYADEQEIYSVTKDGGVWGRTPGSRWNFVQVPVETEVVCIEFIAAYNSVQDEDHTFYVGESLEIYKTIFKKSLVSMFVSLILLIVGIGMVVYDILTNRKVYVGNSMLYLGCFITIYALWSFNETDGSTLIFNHRITSSFSAFIFLMTMSASFLLFVREFMHIKEQTVWKIICSLSAINFCVCILLQFFNIADLKETVLVTHIIMIVSICYIIGALAYKVVKKQVDHNLKNNLIALIVLIVAALTDMVFYYMGARYGDIIGRFIFLLFAIILGYEATSSSMKILERGKKAKIYEELAMTDSLTHLYNRNCYEMDEKELEHKSGVLIVTCDLNDLKTCNDTLGHAEGDIYIKCAAHMIESVFAEYGKCYRIGGDEFQVLIKKGSTCPIDELIELLYKQEQSYNAGNHKFPIHIAIGYALYDEEKDKVIENACKKADEMMYENKRKYKEKFQACQR